MRVRRIVLVILIVANALCWGTPASFYSAAIIYQVINSGPLILWLSPMAPGSFLLGFWAGAVHPIRLLSKGRDMDALPWTITAFAIGIFWCSWGMLMLAST